MVNMKSKCCQKGYDFEKLDQKLDIMLGDVAYTGNKNIKSIKLKLAGWLQKVVDWLK